MTDLSTIPLLKQLDDAHLPIFAVRLTEWLITDLNQSEEPVPDFTESRAKALLRAAAVVDDPTLHDFARLVEGSGTAVRLAIHDLLQETGLVEDEEVHALVTASVAISNLQSPGYPSASLPTPGKAAIRSTSSIRPHRRENTVRPGSSSSGPRLFCGSKFSAAPPSGTSWAKNWPLTQAMARLHWKPCRMANPSPRCHPTSAHRFRCATPR